MRRNFVSVLFLFIFLGLACRQGTGDNKFVKKTENKDNRGEKDYFVYVAKDYDIPDFNRGYLDYNVLTGEVLLLPVTGGMLSSVMVIDKEGNFNLLGENGQSPDRISGLISSAKFIDKNVIGAITFFGERSFVLLDKNEKVFKRFSPLPRFQRIIEFKLYDDRLYFSESVLKFKDRKSSIGASNAWIIMKTELGDMKKRKVLLTKGEFLSKIDMDCPGKEKAVGFAVFFFNKSERAVISYRGCEYQANTKSRICAGGILNLKTEKIKPFYLKLFFRPGKSVSRFVGVSKFKDEFYFFERYFDFVHRNGDWGELTDSERYGVFHVFDKNGVEKGVYRFPDSFYNYLKNQSYIFLSVSNVIGLMNNEIVFIGIASSNKEKKWVPIVVKVKLIPLKSMN